MAKKMFGQKPHQVQVEQTRRTKAQVEADMARHMEPPKEILDTKPGGGSILDYPAPGPDFPRVRVKKPGENNK